MKDYTRFSAKEFAMDDYFQSWVLSPNGNNDSFWQGWLEENPDKRGDVEEARSILLRLNFSQYDLPPEDVSSLWQQIRNHDAPRRQAPNFFSARFLAWSGSIAAMVIMGFSYFFWMPAESMIVYQTAFGETKTIVLPDSSTVILNSNSLLRLNSKWVTTSPREVWLDGEAFFSVVHKKNNQPFKVKTGEEVDIEVLGTTFNVYHRDETKVVLNSGRIQLSLPTVEAEEKILMKPGELVEYNEKKYVKRKVDPKIYTSWTQHNLVLNRTSLREMLHMVKDNYGITVQADESLLNQTISGSMPVTNAESLLEQMAKAFQLKVVREGDRIYLKE